MTGLIGKIVLYASWDYDLTGHKLTMSKSGTYSTSSGSYTISGTFEYTYLNLPLHTWYCGVALLLAPTIANAFWNKGGWIQNRANTLALWCMFAQVVPSFQNHSRFTTLPVVYADAAKFVTDATGRMDPNLVLTSADANPTAQGVVAILAIAINILVIMNIIKRAKEQKKNPYTNEIFVGTRDYQLAMERAAK